MQIVLGSTSPRRKEIMELMGFDFIVVKPNVDENITEEIPKKYVKEIVRRKGNAVIANYPNDLVICADTIVVCDNKVLGKPKDKQDARKMITALADKEHVVLTAVFISKGGKTKVFIEKTRVFVDKLSNEEIIDYINTSEPYDKAGAYGIQGIFGRYIKKVIGDYYNVMGLPLNRTYQLIKSFMY